MPRPLRGRRAATACILAATLGAGCAAEAPAPLPEAAPGPYEATLEEVPGVGLAMGVEIAGGAHRLLFDPGAGLTLLTPQGAAALGCQPWGRVVLRSAAGEPRALERCGDMSLRIGPVLLGAPTAILDPAPESLTAAGLSGIASLQTLGPRPVTLELGQRRIVLETDASLAARTPGMRPVEARLGREAAGLATRLFLGVGTPRGPLWLLAGGGTDDRASIAPHALALLGADPDAAPGDEVAVSLDLVGLGRIDRQAVVAEGPWDGVLDAGALAGLVLSVDLRDGRAWARRVDP